MPSASWANGWLPGDIMTAAEFKKGVGCIYDTTLGVAAASIDVTGIVATYAHLLLVSYLRGDTATATITVALRFNNDSGANYDAQSIANSAATTLAAGENIAATSGNIDRGVTPGGTAAASEFGAMATLIPAYAGTTGQKSAISMVAGRSGTTTGLISTMLCSTFWRSTAAINRITLLPSAGNFVAGSRLSIYALGA
jgi:hypothetical protein